jgi:hypothetical protein
MKILQNSSMFSAMIVTFLLFYTYCVAAQDARSTRTECIVKINFESKLVVNNNIVNSLGDSVSQGISRFNRLNGVKISYSMHQISDNEINMYWQYHSQCADKSSHTSKILSELGQGFEEYFDYKVSQEKVLPGTNTIELSGKDWKDS